MVKPVTGGEGSIKKKSQTRDLEGRKKHQQDGAANTVSLDQEEPIQLPNGKWECNHKCKDKAT